MTALASTYGFTADRGATFTQVIKYKDDSNNALNLSGFTGVMVIRQRTNVAQIVMTLSTDNERIAIDGPTGTITLQVSASDMVIEPGRYTYTFEVTSSGGEVTRLLMGDFIVRTDVYRL